MRFLVRIEVRLDPLQAAEERSALIASEERRGRELKAEGRIVQIWRIPGRIANVGIWDAASPTELHEALTSLPVFPFAEIEVTALAAHHLSDDPESLR